MLNKLDSKPAHHVLAEAKGKLLELNRRIANMERASSRCDEARRQLEIVAGDVLAGMATAAAEAQARASLAEAETVVSRAATDLPIAQTARVRLQDALQRLQQNAWDSQRAEDYGVALPVVRKWIQKYEALRAEADTNRAIIVALQNHYIEDASLAGPRLFPTDGGVPNPVMQELCTNPNFLGGGRTGAMVEALRAWEAKTEVWLRGHACRTPETS